jgi:hypothetical protein
MVSILIAAAYNYNTNCFILSFIEIYYIKSNFVGRVCPPFTREERRITIFCEFGSLLVGLLFSALIYFIPRNTPLLSHNTIEATTCPSLLSVDSSVL